MIVVFGPNGINHTNIFPALEMSKSECLSGHLDYFKPLSENDNIRSNLPFLGHKAAVRLRSDTDVYASTGIKQEGSISHWWQYICIE